MIADLQLLDVHQFTGDDANRLWERVRRQTICFDDFTRDNGYVFAARLASPTTAAFLYKDSGLITVEQIIPRMSGVIHFFYWDPNLREADLVEIGRDVCRYAFGTYELHRLTAAPPSFNKLAQRIASRIGFRYEGAMREAYLYKGQFHDLLLYGLLRDDFAGKVV